jgi:hypothetical protein
VHDIKVPISALYLMIDGLEEEDQKEALEMQISYIEQYTQRILYHVKAKSFQDDYKITRTQTKKIIASALKPYATFYSHKKIVFQWTLRTVRYRPTRSERVYSFPSSFQMR